MRPDVGSAVTSMSRRVEDEVDVAATNYRGWASNFTDWTSVHGLVWYNRTENKCVRLCVTICAAIVVFGLPTFLIVVLVGWAQDVNVVREEVWNTAKEVQYPYLTVCHPRYFNKTKLEEYNIDDTLANYMIMTLDPSLEVMAAIVRGDQGVPTMAEMLSLEADLQTVLTRENTTLGQLFKKVAISCEQFVSYCDIRGNRSTSCCDTVFDPDPIFTFTGTCFKMNMTIYERIPFVFSSINVWLILRNEITPKFEMRWSGMDALQRTGVFYVLTSGNDLAVSKLLVKPMRARGGTTNSLALQETVTDRTELSRSLCSDGYSSFLETYGYPYSYLNCVLTLATSIAFQSCSMNDFYGIEPIDSKPSCTPGNQLNGLIQLNDSLDNVALPTCLADCYRKDYKYETEIGDLDVSPLEDVFALLGEELFDKDDTTMIQMHFSTLKYETIKEHHEKILDFLSKIGGWMGLAIGASLISLAELFYFAIQLLRLCCYKKKMR